MAGRSRNLFQNRGTGGTVQKPYENIGSLNGLCRSRKTKTLLSVAWGGAVQNPFVLCERGWGAYVKMNPGGCVATPKKHGAKLPTSCCTFGPLRSHLHLRFADLRHQPTARPPAQDGLRGWQLLQLELRPEPVRSQGFLGLCLVQEAAKSTMS